MTLNKAVFLDRDGTINVDLDHVFQRERLVLIDGAASAIADICRAGYLVIVITNQSCIGRGYALPSQVDDTNSYLQELLLSEDKYAKITSFKVAPDHPDNPSDRRKPGPGMILEAAKEHLIDLEQSWMIGDKVSDPMAGLNAGIPKRQCIMLVPSDAISAAEEFPVSKSLRQVVSEKIVKS